MKIYTCFFSPMCEKRKAFGNVKIDSFQTQKKSNTFYIPPRKNLSTKLSQDTWKHIQTGTLTIEKQRPNVLCACNSYISNTERCEILSKTIHNLGGM